MISAVVSGCGRILHNHSSEKLKCVQQSDEAEQQVCNRAEEAKRSLERMQTYLTELKATKQERLRQMDLVTHDIDQYMLLLNTLKRNTEDLCLNGSAIQLDESHIHYMKELRNC